MQQQDNHEYPFLYQRQTCHQVQPNQATYQKRQKCQPATYLQEVLDRKSGSAGMPRPTSYAVFCLKKKYGGPHHVESVSCANLLGTSMLQALVSNRRSDAADTLDV